MTVASRPSSRAAHADAAVPDAPGRSARALLWAYRADLVALAALAIAAGMVFRASLTGSALYIGDFDRPNNFLNILRHQVEGLKRGHMVAWSDAAFMGWNTLALPYTFPNPLTLLAAAFPIEDLFRVQALISLSLLVLAGWAGYVFVRDQCGQPFPAFVAAMLYQFSAFSVLKVSQNDMSFAVVIHLPLALLVLRHVTERSLARSLLYLTPIIASLFLFTFLQKVAYGGMMLGLYAVYRSWMLRSWRPFVVLCLASAIGFVAGAPRVLTVVDELRFVDRGRQSLNPPTFDQVYAFQNVTPRELLRWFDASIFGRYASEVLALGNNMNIHEGMLLWGSTFAALLLAAVAVGWLVTLARRRDAWRSVLRRPTSDVPFFVGFMLLVALVFAAKWMTYIFWVAFGGLDFTHARIVVAGLVVQAGLVAIGLRTLMQPRGGPAPRFTLVTVVAGVLVGVGLYGAVVGLSSRGGTETLPSSASLPYLAKLNAQLLLTGQARATPSPPDRVAMAAVSLSQFDITWSPADGAAGYVIEAQGPGMPVFQEIGRAKGGVQAYRVSDVAMGETYTSRIRACGTADDASTCSAPSATAEVAMPAARVAPPSVPPAPTVTVKTREMLELRWPDHESFAAYKVELRGRGNDRFREVATLAPGETVRELGDLRADTRYTLRVRACDGPTCSDFGKELTVETNAPTSAPPAAPSEARPAAPPSAPSATAASPTELRVTWQSVAGADSYAIEAKGETDPEFVEVGRVRDGATLTMPTKPDTATSFRYRWCAAERCSPASQTTRTASPADLPPLVPAHGDELWFISGRSLLKIEWAAVALGMMLLVLARTRRSPWPRAVLVTALGVAMLCEATTYAEEQVNGPQDRAAVPYAQGDFVMADPQAFKIPGPAAQQAFRDALEQDRYRAVVVCAPGQAAGICSPHISGFWQLRLADGYVPGIPRRLTRVPWSDQVLGLRTITFQSFESLPWPLLSFVGVKYAIGVTPSFYTNVPEDGTHRDVLPSDVRIAANPLPPIPRELFAASIQPVLDLNEDAAVTFASGPGTVPDVAARSIVEQYDGPLDLAAEGTISARYGDDAVDVDLSPSGRPRFLVLNELYHPLWRATVDGAPAKIYPTNVTMRGVVIPPGATHVQMRFEPFARLPVLLSFVATGIVLLIGGVWAAGQWEQGRLRLPFGVGGSATLPFVAAEPARVRGRSLGARARAWVGSRPFLALALVTAGWLSLEYLVLGPYSWMYGYGASLETIPAHLALAQTGSTWSLWAPSVAGGLDRLSFWGNADPFNVEPLLFTLLPTWLANGLHVFVQRLVAVYFTARVCADQLRLERRWCLLAALVHAGLGYFTVGEMFAFPSVPLLIWLLPLLAERRRWWAVAPAAGALYSTLVTFSQSAPYLLVFVVGWAALVLGRRDWRLYAAVGLFFAGLAVIELPQTLATLANAPFSHRAGFALEPVSLSLGGLFYYQLQFDFLDQDKLLRAIAVMLAPAALGVGLLVVLIRRSRSRESRLLLRVGGLYALLSLKVAWIGAQALVVLVLPWLGGLYMGRFYALPAAFMIAVLTALSANVLADELRRPLLRRVPLVAFAGAVTVLLVWPKVSLYYPLMVDNWGERSYQVSALDALKRTDTSVYRVASVLDLQPGYAYAQGFETADGWSNLYPAVYRELWLRVIAPVIQALPSVKGVFDPTDGRPQDHYIFLGLSLGYAPIGPLPGEDPRRALESGFDLDRRFNLPLLSLLNVKYLLSRFPLKGDGYRLVHAPAEPPRVLTNYDYATGLLNSPATRLGDVSLTDWPARIASDGFQAIERKRAGKDLYVYENTRVLPRFRLVSRVEVLDSGPAVLDRLAGMPIDQLGRTAVVERADAGEAGPALTRARLSGGEVIVACYTPDEIVLRTRGQGEGFLVIGNTWNPAWQATVDGQPARLLRTNHAQAGLATPAGQHEVRLRYAPWYAGPLALTSWLRSRVCEA